MAQKTAGGNRLFWKISAVFTIWLIILGIVYLMIASYTSRRFFYEVNQQLYGDIAAHLSTSTQPIKNGVPDTLVIHDLIHSTMVVNPSVEVYLLNNEGRIIDYVVPKNTVRTDRVDLAPVRQYIAEKGRHYIDGVNPKHPGQKSIFSAAPIYENGQQAGYVYAVLASEKQATVLAALNQRFFLHLGTLMLLVALGTSIIVGAITYTMINGSLRRTAAIVQRFKDGDYTARVPEQGKGSLGILTSTFNDMANTIVGNIEQLSATDRLRQELIANVSHDLRTPLAIMQGYIETLQIKREKLSPAEQEKFLDIVHDSSKNLSRLIAQLFEYSKLEASQTQPVKEPVSASELVNDIVTKYQLLAHEKNITLSMEAPAGMPPVMADIAMMERVIQNLLDNALKFTGPGGVVKVVVRERGSAIEIAISDNGAGIPHHQQPLIFERYKQLPGEQTQDAGMGLGLAIVKKILDLHQTDIHIQSEPGEGTTFRFQLAAC